MTKSFTPLAVVCPGCGQTFHRTTVEYDPTLAAHGRMFELHPAYGPAGENWTSFPRDDSVVGSDLVCPGCGGPYTSGGTRVRTRDIGLTPIPIQLHEERMNAESDPEVVAQRENTLKLLTEGASEDGAEAEPEPEPVQKMRIGG